MARGMLLLSLLASTCSAEPPRVVSCLPDMGDTGVDPALSEIRIEFDQDMRSGQSMCGGGPTFPVLVGDPRWESPRVFVANVKLEPGREYGFSINCPSALNFRSSKGEPAEVTRIAFRTAAEGETPKPSRRLTPGDNAPAIDALRRAIDERYSYRDLRVKDWDALFATHEGEMMAARTPAAFARAAARLLAPAQDIHIRLAVNDQLIPTHRAGAKWNINPTLVRTLVPGFEQHNAIVATGRWPDGVGYLQIASWPGGSAGEDDALGPALEAITRMADGKALLIDVRQNGGGSEPSARRIAGLFVRETTTYSLSRLRDATSPDAWGEPIPRRISPSGERFEGRVVVLIGRGCVSSNESFILMMKHGAGAVLIGETTYGSSGNPRGTTLGNGVEVSLPSWQDLFPDGTLLEGRGIPPDVAAGNGADFKADDPVIEAALRHVRRDE